MMNSPIIMASTTVTLQEKKKKHYLRFSSHVKVKKIRTHRNYTDHERQLVWYTSEEYRTFKMNEIHDTLNTCISPSALKFEKIQRTKRINEIRYLIVRAQDVHRNVVHNGLTTATTTNNNYIMPDYFTKWLADLYHHHSRQCVKEGRQRGIENDLDTIKLRRKTSSTYMLLQRSALFKKLTVSSSSSSSSFNISINKNTENDRWIATATSTTEGEGRISRRDSIGKRTMSSRSFNSQISTNPVKKRSKRLQQILNKDLDLTHHNSNNAYNNVNTKATAILSPTSMLNSKSRWSATTATTTTTTTTTNDNDNICTKSKNNNANSSNCKDIPLKPMRHTLTPPYLIDTN
jgi:hypothetical protein